MIKKIKLGLQMIQYAYGLKSSLFGMCCFLLAGILMRLVPFGNLFMPNLFLMLTAIWPAQLIYSLSVSELIQTSTQKKAMQTSIPALITAVDAIPMFLLAVVLSIRYRNDPDAKSALLLGALGIFFLLIYAGTAYKFFVPSTIIFIIGYGVVGNLQYLCLASERVQGFLQALQFATVVVFGLLMIVAGTIVAYALSLIFYRYPLSKAAQMNGLRKRM